MDSIKQLIDSRPGFASMQTPASQAGATRLNDFIYMSEGTSNAYMVLTDAGRVIINTGMGWEAFHHRALFDEVCPGPTPYILVTQGHVDHVGGVSHFREEATQFIAQANNAACQRDDQRIAAVRSSQSYIWFQKTMDAAMELAAKHPERFVQDQPVADATFEDHYTLDSGGLQFELYATPGGETIDSCVAWLPQHQILFSGNLFGPLFPHFPNFNTIRGDKYRLVEPYLESLARVRALEPELLITGHFLPIEGRQLIRECLDRMAAAVEHVHRETLQGMNAGKDIYTLMREVSLPPELEIGVGYGKVSWAVRTIWETYMGWFKAQSTTELYPTLAREVYPDLVELAGMDAVVARGRGRLESGDPEAALHLAEVALASEGSHPVALQLAIDVHRALARRAGTGNFWENGWLQHRIRQLEKNLAQI